MTDTPPEGPKPPQPPAPPPIPPQWQKPPEPQWPPSPAPEKPKNVGRIVLLTIMWIAVAAVGLPIIGGLLLLGMCAVGAAGR